MKKPHDINKIPTLIPGFDELSEGGLPAGRSTVISGSAGSGKTIFGLEFLYRGAKELGEPGLFVTFEERRDDLLAEVESFGWDFTGLEKRGRLAFVDASRVAENQTEVGEYDFGALVARIRWGVERVKAKRVVIDSIGSLFLRYRDQALVRRELFRIISVLRELGVTTVITAERVNDEDRASRFGVEDFVADSVIFLYNTALGRQRERQIEIVKLRGGSHQTGRYPLLISAEGLTVFPRESLAFAKDSSLAKVSSGVSGLDAMTDGGIFSGSTTLLLGPSGTGRTVLGIHFLDAGIRRDERCLLLSFEESKAQVLADAKSIGRNFAAAVRRGQLRIHAWQPESRPLEFYLKRIKEVVGEFKPSRVVIDSLTPLASSVDEQRFRRFVLSMNSYLKSFGITSLVSYTTGEMETSVAAESDLAVVADNIIVMRFAESAGQIERNILIAKSRASAHDKSVRQYAITDDGFCVTADGAAVCADPAVGSGSIKALRRKSRRAAPRS